MEGERDGALEDSGRPRELALIPVGGEAVERVSADLRLDALFAERGDLVRGAVALPFHTRLSESDLDRVAEALTRLVSK